MAKKTVTEVLEIEAGAVIEALKSEGWPISSIVQLEVLDTGGRTMSRDFGGFRFTYVHDTEIVRPKKER